MNQSYTSSGARTCSTSSILDLIRYVGSKSSTSTRSYDIQIQSSIGMISTLDGRDKVTKLLQYISRLLSWYYITIGNNKQRSIRFAAVKTQLANSRKAYRLGRTGIELYKLYCMKWIGSIQVKEPMWKRLGTAIKTLALGGYWLGDNINYLSLSGFFDDYSDTNNHKINESIQKQVQTKSAIFANRCYFVAAIVGLYLNVRSYKQFVSNQVRQQLEYQLLLEQQKQKQQEQHSVSSASSSSSSSSAEEIQTKPRSTSTGSNNSDTNYDQIIIADRTDDSTFCTSTDHHKSSPTCSISAQQNVDTPNINTNTTNTAVVIRTASQNDDKVIKEQQLTLALATMKSIADVIVFSNNPGIDLWQQYYGSKLHEAIHCCCGIISACTVLYTNYPSSSSPSLSQQSK